MASSVDPDQMPRSAASDQDLRCLLRPVCPNYQGKYSLASYIDFSSVKCEETEVGFE